MTTVAPVGERERSIPAAAVGSTRWEPRAPGTPRWLRAALALGVVWTAVAVVMAAGYTVATPESPFAWRLRHFLPFYWVWALLTPVVFRIARVAHPSRRGWPAALALHLLAAGAVAGVHLAAYAPLSVWVERGAVAVSSLPRLITSTIVRHGPGDVLVYGLVAAAWYADDYRARARAALADARLHTLRIQLEPHFLLNSLQVASSLMHQDVAAADLMMERLGAFLRLVLRRDDRHLVPLGEELALLDHYLAVMQMRFGDRLRVIRAVDPHARSALVPVLMLQPLVENALTHGLGDRPQGGTVTIGIAVAGHRLAMTVADDGDGVPTHVREQVGLLNTRQRLQHLFGSAFTIDIARVPEGGTRVTVDIPFRPARPERA